MDCRAGFAVSACLTFLLSIDPAWAERKRAPNEVLQVRQATQLSSEPRYGKFIEGASLPPSTRVETVEYEGDWHLVRDEQGRAGWLKSRLLEPVGSCHDDGDAQFRFVARHFGFISKDQRFEKAGLPTAASRSLSPIPEQRHLSHTALSLKMGLDRYEDGTAAILLYHGASASCIIVADKTGIVAYHVNTGVTGNDVERAIFDYVESLVPPSCLKARSPERKENSRDAGQLQRAIEQCELWKGAASAQDGSSGALAQILFPPAIERTLLRYKNIIIVPYGALAIVPYAAVVLPESGASFVEKFSYTIAPAFTQIGIGKGLHQKRGSAPPRPTGVVVGNPKYDDKEWNFPDLPGAEAEAIAVAKLIGATPLVGLDAALASLRANLPPNNEKSPDILYFATHGMASRDDPEAAAAAETDYSFVALANGERLSAHTLDQTGYRGSRLVVLSACFTGRGWIAESGAIGLPRLFHTRGAEEVVMSLWQVDDEATAALMSAFMAEYTKSWPQASAAKTLRSAILKVRKDYARPAYWAPFAVFGVGPF